MSDLGSFLSSLLPIKNPFARTIAGMMLISPFFLTVVTPGGGTATAPTVPGPYVLKEALGLFGVAPFLIIVSSFSFVIGEILFVVVNAMTWRLVDRLLRSRHRELVQAATSLYDLQQVPAFLSTYEFLKALALTQQQVQEQLRPYEARYEFLITIGFSLLVAGLVWPDAMLMTKSLDVGLPTPVAVAIPALVTMAAGASALYTSRIRLLSLVSERPLGPSRA